MNNNSSSPTREERYKETMNPFSEYLPDIWPSNSDAYLTLLATKMRAAGLTGNDASENIVRHLLKIFGREE